MSALFAVALIGISFFAYDTARRAQVAVLESQSGSVSEASLDPAAPGFRAFTEPTPVALVLHTAVSATSGEGPDLVGASLLIASGSNVGGTVMSVPASIQRGGEPTLEVLFRQEGIDAVITEVETIFAIGFGEVVSLDAASWTTLMAPELPLDVALREDLVDSNGETLVAAGLGPFRLSDVAVIAGHRNPGEEALSVALRQQEIWKSWISRSASSGRSELPLVEQGFVEVITSLAGGPVNYRVVPIRASFGVGSESTYVLDEDIVALEIAQLVPFPEPAVPGARTSLLLLDGTGGQADGSVITSAVVLAGGQVAVLGNTDAAGAESSRIEVHAPDASGFAAELASLLAGVPIVDVPLDDSTVDATLVIGEDLVGLDFAELSTEAAE